MTTARPRGGTKRLDPVQDERLPTLVLDEGQAPHQHPYDVYLARLASPETRRTMAGCLDRMARILAGIRLDAPPADSGLPVVTGAWVPWWELQYEDTAALRAIMIERGWSDSHVNKHLSALRSVIKECWRMDLVDGEVYRRAVDLEPVSGEDPDPAGRDVGENELADLVRVCDDGTITGIRDAALIATIYVTGIRRSEAAALPLQAYDVAGESLRVHGKGNKKRTIPVSDAAIPWLEAWLRVRGRHDGPLFCPLRKGGVIVYRHMSAQTVADIMKRRTLQAVLPGGEATPHDLRRTLIGDLLDQGVDLVTAQKIAGHADPSTTSKYDRRKLDEKRDALNSLTLPRPAAS